MATESDIIIKPNAGSRFTLGDWQVEPRANLIRQGDTVVSLERQIMDLLVYLARHAGEVVSANQIIDAVWHERVVSDSSLYQAIAQLRRALSDSAKQPRYIETVPKRGYRLAAPVTLLDGGQDTVPALAAAEPAVLPPQGASVAAGRGAPVKKALIAALAVLIAFAVGVWLIRALPISPKPPVAVNTVAVNTVAVLPFRNLSQDLSDDYFADGIAEELLNTLAQFDTMRVVARTSSFAFKGVDQDVRTIGKRLGVDRVVTGAVRKNGNQLRVTAQLINAQNGFNLWSASYDRQLGDIFAIQEDIAQRIASALGAATNAAAAATRATTQDVTAFDFYLLGRHQFHQRTGASLRRAVVRYRQAIRQDPSFALAYKGLVDAYLLLTEYGTMPLAEAVRQARPALAKALELAPELGEVQASRGLFYYYLGDYTDAETALREALRLSPSYSMAALWLGLTLNKQGKIDAAHEFFARALSLDPLHVTVNVDFAYNLRRQGQCQQALARLQRLAQDRPQSAQLYRNLAKLSLWCGRFASTLRWAKEAQRLDPQNPLNAAVLAWVYEEGGKYKAADRQLARALRAVPDHPDLLRAREAIYIGNGEFKAFDQFAQRRLAELGDETEQPVPSAGAWRRVQAGMARLLLGDYRQAIDYLEPELSNNFALEERDYSLHYYTSLGFAYRELGQTARLEKTLAQIEALIGQLRARGWDTPLIDYNEARLWALQNRTDAFVAALERAIDRGFRFYDWLLHDPIINQLKDEPRVAALLTTLKSEVEQQRRQ